MGRSPQPDDGSAEMTEREDVLDRYRQEVERLLGEQLWFAREDDFESFFEHVVSCFERRLDGETCALTWLARVARKR